MINRKPEIHKLDLNALELLQPLVDAFVHSHPTMPFRENLWSVFRGWLADSLENSDTLCLVARVDDAAVGFILGDVRQNVPLLLPDRIGYVSILVVDPTCRSTGIGDALWQAMKAWFLSRGVDHFELFTEYGNPVSRPFWAKRGFEVVMEKRRSRNYNL